MVQRKVLIIDDENVICQGVEMVLGEQALACEHCLSGKEGVKRALTGDFDLILLDMKLKDMDGMDILDRIKREKPELNVLVITGYSTVENTVKAMKLGANDYLSKPFSDNDLMNAINTILGDD